jgi:hypothetical protein
VYCCAGHEKTADDKSKAVIREKQSFGRMGGGIRAKESREIEVML